MGNLQHHVSVSAAAAGNFCIGCIPGSHFGVGGRFMLPRAPKRFNKYLSGSSLSSSSVETIPCADSKSISSFIIFKISASVSELSLTSLDTF